MLTRYRMLFLVLLCCGGLAAQTCNYQLVMDDSTGDGWNGGFLTVRVGGVATEYTITDDPAIDDGARRIVFFPVTDGQTLEIDWTQGAFPEENAFTLLDNDDAVLYQSDTPIEEGPGIFSTTVMCATCFSPAGNSVELFRIRSASVDYRFNSALGVTDPTYLIEYRAGDDYDPEVDEDGIALVTPDTSGRVFGLEPDTAYTFYVSTICPAEMDTAQRRGPFVFTTQKVADVGVTILQGPVSDCDLGSEEVTIGITNFGGAPQAFFNVDFAINGQPAGVSRPDDGIFTGIVGVDSTEFFTFDTRALLAAPGNYVITAWTELEGDEDTANDTMSFTVTHTPLIDQLPYAEDFEDNDGFWNPTSPTATTRGNNSWAWGEPAGAAFTTAPQGRSAWATGLDRRYNNNEISYLNSPCFDFTDLDEDPLFSAVLRMSIETNFDQFTLEMTTDDGETWEKIETAAGTVNWYNNLQFQYWTNDGGFPAGGPTMASAVLSGAAGNEIQLRFVFRSSGSGTDEGVLVDVVSITERYDADLAAVTGSAASLSDCGSASDDIQFSFTNRGGETVTDFAVNYRVDGGTVVTETFTDNVLPGATATYQFSTPFNSTLSAENIIEVWTSLGDDELLANDTTLFYFRSSELLPFLVDFEDGAIPANWLVDDTDLSVSQPPGSPSLGLSDSLSAADQEMQFQTANYGLVEAGDELRFDLYLRTADSGDPFTGPVDVEVRVYPDCTDDFQTLADFTASRDTTFLADLSGFEGQSLRFEVIATWVEGDFFFVVDNFGVIRCAGLELTAATTGTSGQGATDGSATIDAATGFGPYTYAWSSGDTTATVDGLALGDYTVTVTDAFGCTDVISFMIDLASGTDDATELLEGIAVFPNPTAGHIELRLDLPASTQLRAALYDMTGRQLLDRDYGRQLQLNETFDLSAYPAGVYLLRVQADEAAKTIRIMKR